VDLPGPARCRELLERIANASAVAVARDLLVAAADQGGDHIDRCLPQAISVPALGATGLEQQPRRLQHELGELSQFRLGVQNPPVACGRRLRGETAGRRRRG